jgi:hypothetical protein
MDSAQKQQANSHVPFILSCPSCGYPHQTSMEMAECLEHSTGLHNLVECLQRTNNITVFNYQDGSVVINGKLYSSEQYEGLCQRVTEHLHQKGKP